MSPGRRWEASYDEDDGYEDEDDEEDDEDEDDEGEEEEEEVWQVGARRPGRLDFSAETSL